MIVRIWHGYTTPENADAYQTLLRTTVFPSIEAKKIAGFRRIELLRRPLEREVEFITVMHFDSWQAVEDFAGKDYERAHVPAPAREVLARFDERSQHYEVLEQRDY